MIQQLNSLRQDLNTISNMSHQLSQAEQHNSMQLQRMHQLAEGMERSIQHMSGHAQQFGTQQFGTQQFGTSIGQAGPFTTPPYSTQFGAHPNMGVIGATSNPIGAALGQNFIGQGQISPGRSQSLAPVSTPFENPVAAAQRNFEHSYEQAVHPNMGLVGHSSNPISAAHRQNLNYGHNWGQNIQMNRPYQESNPQWSAQGTNVSFSGAGRSGFGIS